jgi:hypothetical protein
MSEERTEPCFGFTGNPYKPCSVLDFGASKSNAMRRVGKMDCKTCRFYKTKAEFLRGWGDCKITKR